MQRVTDFQLAGVGELPRRRLLQSFALIGSAAATASVVGIAPGTAEAAVSRASLNPIAAQDPELYLKLQRATFGATPALMKRVQEIGFDQWLTNGFTAAVTPFYWERYQAIYAETDRWISEGEERLVGMWMPSSVENRDEYSRKMSVGIIARQVLHGAFGGDHLRQRVVDVLSDLLNVCGGVQPLWWHMGFYDRVLRGRAFGRYDALVLAVAKTPAMLVYLNQNSSRADGGRRPIENFARELLELHTVGADAGYNEQDVIEASYVLSGWGLNDSTRSFVFRPERHSLGPLRTAGDVFGWVPPKRNPVTAAEMEANGVSLIRYLAAHPKTANRIALKFVRYFVTETATPTHPMVVGAAKAYTANGTSLRAVLDYIFRHPDFSKHATLMLRRPVDLMIHSLRQTRATWTAEQHQMMVATIHGCLRVMGHVPYRWPTPEGYPTGSAAWANPGAVVGRTNSIISVFAREADGVRFDWSHVGATDAKSAVVALCGPDHQLY